MHCAPWHCLICVYVDTVVAKVKKEQEPTEAPQPDYISSKQQLLQSRLLSTKLFHVAMICMIYIQTFHRFSNLIVSFKIMYP